MRDSFGSKASYVFLKTIHTVVNDLGYSAIQEGVETEEQLTLVNEFGCDMIQGFYFSKALPEEEFMEFIEAKHD